MTVIFLFLIPIKKKTSYLVGWKKFNCLVLKKTICTQMQFLKKVCVCILDKIDFNKVYMKLYIHVLNHSRNRLRISKNVLHGLFDPSKSHNIKY